MRRGAPAAAHGQGGGLNGRGVAANAVAGEGQALQSRSGTGTLKPFKVVETSAYRPTR